MKKRFVSLALLLCLVLTLCPVQAFAAEEGVEEVVLLEEPEAEALVEEAAEPEAVTLTEEDAVTLSESREAPESLPPVEEVNDIVINSVSVTMSEPYIGDTPDLSPSVPEDANYTVSEVKWFEEDGTLISYPELYTFRSGKVIVAIILHANSGYTFSTGSMTATVNEDPNTYDFSSTGNLFHFYFTFEVSESYHGKPVFSSEPTNQTAANGSYVQFECVLKRFTVGTTLLWESRTSSAGTWTAYKTTTLPVSSDSGSVYCDSISFQVSEEMNGYQYRVTAENEYGRVTSTFATLTVTASTDLPKIAATKPEDKEVLVGNSVALTVSFTNYDSATTVAWYYREPGGSWTPCTSPPYAYYNNISFGLAGLSFTAQSSMDGYQFYCRVTNAAGSSDSRVATLRITSVSQVEVTITPPAVGASPSYVASVPSGVHYSVNLYSSGNYLNGVAWQNGTTEGYLNPKAIVSAFSAGFPFRVYVYLNAVEGYVFSDQITATVNGNAAEIESLTETGGTLQISYLFPALSEAGWQKDSKGWWYKRADGTYPKNQWEEIDGKWYHFDASGYMQTGWLKLGTKWYYLDSSGAMVTGWQKISNKWYWFTSSGVMQTGWKQLGGKWYYFESSGAMATGLKQIGGKWYYFESSGAMYAKAGWKQIGTKWYYFDSSGAAQVGWQKINGKWYYFNASADMVTGWKQISGKWYYFESSGVMHTGWLKLSGKWYWFDSSGVMAANCTKTIGGKSYTFDKNGVCTNP